jgi:uncharacterized protein (DUF305 family)
MNAIGLRIWLAIALGAGFVAYLPAQTRGSETVDAAEERFIAANEAAMKRMMLDMTIRRTGDIDRDFAELMIPHHQSAIDMARAELQFGRNEQMRRIAHAIIVGQQQQIVAMQVAVNEDPDANGGRAGRQ